MEAYTEMRHFADSWGLLAMVVFFVGAVAFAFRPGSRAVADEVARIPLEDDIGPGAGPGAGPQGAAGRAGAAGREGGQAR